MWKRELTIFSNLKAEYERWRCCSSSSTASKVFPVKGQVHPETRSKTPLGSSKNTELSNDDSDLTGDLGDPLAFRGDKLFAGDFGVALHFLGDITFIGGFGEQCSCWRDGDLIGDFGEPFAFRGDKVFTGNFSGERGAFRGEDLAFRFSLSEEGLSRDDEPVSTGSSGRVWWYLKRRVCR